MSRPTLRLFDGFEGTSVGLRDDVRELQGLLNGHGAGLETDGLFGRGTESAVERFQSEHGLVADGIAGRQTWAALLGTAAPDPDTTQETTYPRNDASLLEQLEAVKAYEEVVLEGASACLVEPSIVCGIGSRESHWGLLLDPPGPAGTGDTIRRSKRREWRPGDLPPDGRGFGRGLMQIDYDAHLFARGDEWQDPNKNILYGCTVLKQNVVVLKRKTDLAGPALLRAAVAAYNCGAGNVLKAVHNDRDVDYYTHGRDYSRDTLNRAGWFQIHGWA